MSYCIFDGAMIRKGIYVLFTLRTKYGAVNEANERWGGGHNVSLYVFNILEACRDEQRVGYSTK